MQFPVELVEMQMPGRHPHLLVPPVEIEAAPSFLEFPMLRKLSSLSSYSPLCIGALPEVDVA